MRAGNLGVHIHRNPAGSWSFVGSIPGDLAGQTFDTERAAQSAFVRWYREQPTDWQRENIGHLRNDIQP